MKIKEIFARAGINITPMKYRQNTRGLPWTLVSNMLHHIHYHMAMKDPGIKSWTRSLSFAKDVETRKQQWEWFLAALELNAEYDKAANVWKVGA